MALIKHNSNNVNEAKKNNWYNKCPFSTIYYKIKSAVLFTQNTGGY